LLGLGACAERPAAPRERCAASSPEVLGALSTEPAPAPPSPAAAQEPQGKVTFVGRSGAAESVTLAELVRSLRPVELRSEDPYYGDERTYRCLPAQALLGARLGLEAGEVVRHRFLLVAADGYRVELSGALLARPEACFAFAEAGRAEWQPIGERRSSPGPLYLVWEGDLKDVHAYPRPWAVVRIEVDPTGEDLTLTRPAGGFGESALAARGYELFTQRCQRCHAINRQGGHVGPELNVPQNVLAYRDRAFVRAYIRDPLTFRYGAMPANPDLDDAALDALLAYLEEMGRNRTEGPGR
jgi:hypothetical protein